MRHEWGIEQIVRDSRVAMIYEGTNEIQAQDLLFRKVLPDQGQALRQVLDALHAETGTASTDMAQRTRQAVAEVQTLLASVGSASGADATRLYPVAGDFLRAVTLALMAWAWYRLDSARAADAPNAGATAFVRWVLPELTMRVGMVRNALGA